MNCPRRYAYYNSCRRGTTVKPGGLPRHAGEFVVSSLGSVWRTSPDDTLRGTNLSRDLRDTLLVGGVACQTLTSNPMTSYGNSLLLLEGYYLIPIAGTANAYTVST